MNGQIVTPSISGWDGPPNGAPIRDQLFEPPNNNDPQPPRKPRKNAGGRVGTAQARQRSTGFGPRIGDPPHTIVYRSGYHPAAPLPISEGNPAMITAEDLKKITLFAPVPESELKSIAARAADVRCSPENGSSSRARRPPSSGCSRGRSRSSNRRADTRCGRHVLAGRLFRRGAAPVGLAGHREPPGDRARRDSCGSSARISAISSPSAGS